MIPIYLYGGFVGGLFFVLSATYIPFVQQHTNNSFLFEGCSAAVVAIVIATTKLSPNYKMFQHIGSGFSLWILTLLFAAIDIAYLYTTNFALVIAHSAAAIIGYLFIVQLQNGNDWSSWMYHIFYWFDDLFNPEKKQRNKTQQNNLFYKN